MELNVNSGVCGAMFGVPCIVADNFLKLATGGQIKALLYILRCPGKPVTEKDIADNTGISEQEAADAILFWQQVNVLSCAEINAEKIPAAASMMSAAQQNAQSGDAPSQESSVPALRRIQLPPSEIAKRINDSHDIAELFCMAESILGSLNHSQQNSIIQMYDYFGLKKEVIAILLTYCKTNDKTDCRYMERVAEDWADKHIDSLDDAHIEVARLNSSRDRITKIMKLFDMNRRPTTKQNEYIEKWGKIGFSDEMLRYAYEKMVENTDKLSFPYIDKILVSWQDSGFRTVDDVKKADEEYRRKHGNTDKSGGVPSDIDKYNVVLNNF